MNILIEDIWPGLSYGSDEQSNTITYPQYVALLLNIGLRLKVSRERMHQLFQLCGNWKMSTTPVETEISKEKKEECGACESGRIYAISLDDKETVGNAKGDHCALSDNIFFTKNTLCAHLAREDAEELAFNPSFPPFLYISDPTDLKNLSSDKSAKNCKRQGFAQVDCIHCFRQQINAALTSKRKREAKNPIEVVNTLSRPLLHSCIANGKCTATSSECNPSLGTISAGQEYWQETIYEHYQRHQLQYESLLNLLDKEKLSTEQAAMMENIVSDVTDDTELELQAEEASRHSCFMSCGGSASCPIIATYCSACDIVGPLTSFERLEEVSSTDDVESNRFTTVHEKKRLELEKWVSKDPLPMIIARLFLALHMLESTFCSSSSPNLAEMEEVPPSSRIGSDAFPLTTVLNSCIRTNFLFLPTPLIFEDPPPSSFDDENQASDADSTGRRHLTCEFEASMEGIESAEAVLPGARWVIERSSSSGGEEDDIFRLEVCEEGSPLGQNGPMLELVPRNYFEDSTQETMEEKHSEESLFLAHDVVVGLLTSFTSAESLKNCIEMFLLPEIQKEHLEPLANYSPLPTLGFYRYVYLPEEERWVEALVLSHRKYSFGSKGEADETESFSTGNKKSEVWLGETPEGFRRAFASYPIFPPESLELWSNHPTFSFLFKKIGQTCKGEKANHTLPVEQEEGEIERNLMFLEHPLSVGAQRLQFLMSVIFIARAMLSALSTRKKEG